MTVGQAQVFFYDTPGFVSHEDRDDYKPALSAASREAIAEVNLTLLLVDASKDVPKRGLKSLKGLLENALRSGLVFFSCPAFFSSNEQPWPLRDPSFGGTIVPMLMCRADGVSSELDFLAAKSLILYHA